MIELIHKYPILIKTLLGITTLAFVATGGFLYMGNDAAGGWVAKIEDQTVTYDEYERLVSRYMGLYNDLYQGEIPEPLRDNIERAALKELIDVNVMLLELDSMGITVGDKQVSENIVQTPDFHNAAGQFDKERYLEILRQNGISPKTYEDSIRRQLAVRLFRDTVNEAADVSDEEVRAYYENQMAAMGEGLDEETYEQQKDGLKGMLKENKEKAVYASVMSELKSRHEIEVNDSFKSLMEPPQPPKAPVQTKEPSEPQAETSGS